MRILPAPAVWRMFQSKSIVDLIREWTAVSLPGTSTSQRMCGYRTGPLLKHS